MIDREREIFFRVEHVFGEFVIEPNESSLLLLVNKVNGFSCGLRVGLVGELPTIMAGLAQVDFVIVRMYLICDILFSNLWILCKKNGI